MNILNDKEVSILNRRYHFNQISFEEIVRNYHKAFPSDESDFFASLSFDEALYHAGHSVDVEGNVYDHQIKIAKQYIDALPHGYLAIQKKKSEIKNANNFDEIHRIIIAITEGIYGLSEMYAYDTAYRIGANLDKWPIEVYLHRGALEGAKAIGFQSSRKKLLVSELPLALHSLTPAQAEDVLCLFKDELRIITKALGWRPQTP